MCRRANARPGSHLGAASSGCPAPVGHELSLRMTNQKRMSALSGGPNRLALLRKRIDNCVDADDGGVRIVVAENLTEIGSVGDHGFGTRLA